MAAARRHFNLTLLPDGTVLATGGTSAGGFNNSTGAVLPAELWDPATENWTTLAAQQELGWHDFDGGIEFRARGWDKGEAVKAILAESGPGAVCAYLGDDLDDEHAFKAIPDSGLSVLVREQFRPTAADLWIQPPQEVREFLVRWQQAGAR